MSEKMPTKNLNAKLGAWRSLQFARSAAVLGIQKDYIVKIQSSIFKFIWKEKQAELKRKFYIKVKKEVIWV